MEDARTLIFGGTQPRGMWLCVNDDGYGGHSLRTYFPDLSADAFTEQYAKLAGRTATQVVHAGETLFKADRSTEYGTNKKWVAFGKLGWPPSTC